MKFSLCFTLGVVLNAHCVSFSSVKVFFLINSNGLILFGWNAFAFLEFKEIFVDPAFISSLKMKKKIKPILM